MRKLAPLLVVSLLVIAMAAVAAHAATPAVSWKSGSIKTVKVKKGGTVKWVWADSAPHNVKGPGFTSKTVAKKGTAYSRKFGKKGTFKIICQVHATTMKTTVKVS